MRKFFVTLVTSLMSCSVAFAFWPEAVESSLELGVGYRQDSLRWKSEADFTLDGVEAATASKFRWHDLDIWQLVARGKYVTCDNIYLRGYADYGWVTHGRVNNKDYLSLDNSDITSSDEVLNLKADANRGHVYDVSFALGYQFRLCDDSFGIAPIVGYSWHGQHLKVSRGHFSETGTSPVTISETSTTSSTSSSSSSSDTPHGKYHTRWNGPFLGLDLEYRFLCDWLAFVSYEYHWTRFHASAGSELRTDSLDGFHQRSRHAHGQIAHVGVRWAFCECWTLGLTGDFQWFRARSGKDKELISKSENGDISEKCFEYNPLKNVRWCSAGVTLDIGMMF